MSIRESRFRPCALELAKKQKHDHVILVGLNPSNLILRVKDLLPKSTDEVNFSRIEANLPRCTNVSVSSLQPEVHMYHNNESWCGDMSAPIIQTVN